ncbi:interleukin-18-binding protein [Pleurodeles waltl]|uniref:interleukin-18-binding protein n=1 Tax=Pleurodeles waltl TaxID=8319 RepID=UPI003709C501
MLLSLGLMLLVAACSGAPSSGSGVFIKFGPKIISPTNRTITPASDAEFQITCQANCSWEDLHLIYWLVNGTFVEDLYPDGRVSEGAPRNVPTRPFFIVESTLSFRSLSIREFRSNFTCVVQDPSGVDNRNFTLRRPPSSPKGLAHFDGNQKSTRLEPM